ncbi:CHASE2 domain-containing protein [Tolypothrix sp. VBCCA 56010]|uniref:CHASE2 domain-containing protein n=1 Tax=Tolypothrix sp. VBCCA 56010 TaxID=3137731 RepID=UPI003D7E64FA
MNQAISDRAAIEFAVGFYDALGAGRSIEFAYNWGCIAIRMEGIEEHFTPVLLKKEENNKVEIFVSNFQEGEKLKKFQTQWLRRIPRRSIFTTLGASVGVTILVVLVRLLGILPGEFFFFNQMMRVQPVIEKPDDSLLIVQITLDDIKYYFKKYPPKNSSSLADEILYQLLEKLLKSNPRVIGIDNYRYAPAEGNLKKLINNEQTNDHLIFICKFPDKDASDKEGHSPPPDVPIEQVGLSNFLTDRDGVIRRQIIEMGTPEDPETKNQCRNKEELMDSFSFKVAQKYLAAEKKDYKIYGKEHENIVSGKTFLEPLNIDMQGGYSLKNLNGTQILLNYRFAADAKNNRSLRNIAARTYNVKQILDTKEIKDFVQDKIVMIGTPVVGYDSPSKSTPFSIGGADEQMSGLFIQAQMVSQLVSAVKDERPLLKVMHISYDMLCILVCSVIGGAILPQLYKHPQKLLIAGGICLGGLYFICLVFFIYPIIPRTKLWIRLVPTAVSFVGSGAVRIFLELKSQKNSKFK